MTAKHDAEMDTFQNDLLESVKQMKNNEAARVTEVELTPVASLRARMGLSQTQFARLLGVSVRTLQQWEQGRRHPTGPARRLLAIAEKRPEVLLEES